MALRLLRAAHASFSGGNVRRNAYLLLTFARSRERRGSLPFTNHKVFGASNASKLLLHVPPPHRFDAVLTIAYEAQARIHDPVHGCVAHIFALQQQVVRLEAELMEMKAKVGAHEWACMELMQDHNNISDHSISPIHGFRISKFQPAAGIMESRHDFYLN